MKILVEVEDGIARVYSDDPEIEIIVVDYDSDQYGDEEKLKRIEYAGESRLVDLTKGEDGELDLTYWDVLMEAMDK